METGENKIQYNYDVIRIAVELPHSDLGLIVRAHPFKNGNRNLNETKAVLKLVKPV